jgi:hypothetical protein
MTIQEIVDALEAQILLQSHDPGRDVPKGGAADLMSDVLAFGSEGMALITGLTNPQVVRTAEMAGIDVIVLVRAKKAPPETLALAEDAGMTVLSTGYTMYEACGRLYKAGLPGLGRVKLGGRAWTHE